MQHSRRPLGPDTQEVLKHLHKIWQFPVHLKSVSPEGEVTASYSCPIQTVSKKEEKQ